MFDFSEFRIRTGVVVSASHPVLGPLYWYFSDESSVNGPNYYGLTDKASDALLLEQEWRMGYPFRRHGNHIREVVANFDEDGNGWAAKAGQTDEEFISWLTSVAWVDVPASARAERHVDHGFFYAWEEFKPAWPAEITGNPRYRSFDLALAARFDWMRACSQELLQFWDMAEASRERALSTARELAGTEALYTARYGAEVPPLFADIPQLREEYSGFFQYWTSLKEASRLASATAELADE